MEATKAWIRLLEDILKTDYRVSPRKMQCQEIVCHTSGIQMQLPIVICSDRDIGYKFMAAEAWWILTGQNRVKTIKEYGDIARFSDDGIHFDGAYGPKVVDQLRYVSDALYSDKYSRQSVMSIWRPNPRDSKDIPCTLTLQWLMRDNLLDCVANMRSSDAWLGWPYDVFNFSMISGYILLLLREQREYPSCSLGTLYINVGSQHLYEKNREAAERIIKQGHWETGEHIFNPLRYPDPDSFIDWLKIIKDKEDGALLI